MLPRQDGPDAGELPNGHSPLRPLEAEPEASESPSDPPPRTPPQQGALRPLPDWEESAGLGDLRVGGVVQVSDEREVEAEPRVRRRASGRPVNSRIPPPQVPGTRRQYVE